MEIFAIEHTSYCIGADGHMNNNYSDVLHHRYFHSYAEARQYLHETYCTGAYPVSCNFHAICEDTPAEFFVCDFPEQGTRSHFEIVKLRY